MIKAPFTKEQVDTLNYYQEGNMDAYGLAKWGGKPEFDITISRPKPDVEFKSYYYFNNT